MVVIFETERLYVRRYNQDDKENFFLLNGNPDVMRFIRPIKTREETDAFLQDVIAYAEETIVYGRWAVCDKKTSEFIGTFALIPVENSDKMQLGYALLPRHGGKGYATELTKTGIRYSFTKTPLDVVYAYTEKLNLSSQKVLEKCGFEKTHEKEETTKILLEYIKRANANSLMR